MSAKRSTAKVRITSELHRSRFRRGAYRYWTYEVTDSTGKVVLTDGSVDFDAILAIALADVQAVRLIEDAGHRIRYSFAELVERAS